MIYSFTGTRNGMTQHQKDALRAILTPADTLHHGDCLGSDQEAHEIARDIGCRIEIHPATGIYRAYCAGNKIYPAKPPLDRNHDIVDAGELLIAAPKSLEEELRSGTWATVRYARKIGKPVVILSPEKIARDRWASY